MLAAPHYARSAFWNAPAATNLPKPYELLLVLRLPLSRAHSPRTLLGGGTTPNLALAQPVSGRESALSLLAAPKRWDRDSALDADDWQRGL